MFSQKMYVVERVKHMIHEPNADVQVWFLNKT